MVASRLVWPGAPLQVAEYCALTGQVTSVLGATSAPERSVAC